MDKPITPKKERIRVSKLIPLFIMILIPLSWAIDVAYSSTILERVDNAELTEEQRKLITDNKAEIPVKELLTFATVVLPAIMLRKAVREGTANMKKDYDSEE
jgi:hypothetical protein